MRKLLYILYITIGLIVVSSCTTLSLEFNNDRSHETIYLENDVNLTDSKYSDILYTIPSDKELYFFVAIPRVSNRENETEYAKYEVARQLVMFESLYLKAKFATKSDSKNYGTLEDIDVTFDESKIKEKIADIKIVKHISDPKGSYFKCSYPNNFNIKELHINKDSLKEHDWMYNIPKIDGYLVSVGTAQRYRYQIDSILKADEQAISNLAKQIHVTIKNKNTTIEKEGKSGYLDIIYEESSTIVKDYYVLGRWISHNGNYYHTLAISKQN